VAASGFQHLLVPNLPESGFILDVIQKTYKKMQEIHNFSLCKQQKMGYNKV